MVAWRTQGGSYTLDQPDGKRWRSRIAAFRLLPYVSRDDPQLQELQAEFPEEDNEED